MVQVLYRFVQFVKWYMQSTPKAEQVNGTNRRSEHHAQCFIVPKLKYFLLCPVRLIGKLFGILQYFAVSVTRNITEPPVWYTCSQFYIVLLYS